MANPILWEKGIRTMLGVPLLSGEDVFGVLHVGRRDHRPFTDNDAELLQVVAERVAGATQDATARRLSPPPPGCSNAACSPAAYRACPVFNWPPDTSPRRAD